MGKGKWGEAIETDKLHVMKSLQIHTKGYGKLLKSLKKGRNERKVVKKRDQREAGLPKKFILLGSSKEKNFATSKYG
jgi:hypothetical protein